MGWLQDQSWFGTKQVLVLSASSKTSIGLGYAIQRDKESPKAIGVTSTRNLETVKNLGIWDEVTADQIDQMDPTIPTVIVDMSGITKFWSPFTIIWRTDDVYP